MKKNYAERLELWVRQRASSPREKNRAAFVAVRDDVREALAQKYPVKVIWQNLHEEGVITFGYDAFLNYVHRFGLHAEFGQLAVDVSNDQKPSTGARRSDVETQTVKVSSTEKHLAPDGFVFNPIPNKEELL